MSLVLNDLALVLEELHDVRKLWYEIGLRLKVSVEDLETISSEHKSDQHSLRRVILLWLKSGNATWSDVSKALRNRTIGKSALGDSLRERYCQGVMKSKAAGGNIKIKPSNTEDKMSKKISSSRKAPQSRPGSKMSSQDLSSNGCLTLDTSDSGSEIIIDIGSPLSEKNEGVDGTPTSGTRKRSLDEQTSLPESKKVKMWMELDSFSQDDFARAQPAERQCTNCDRIPLTPQRTECCNALYCQPCSTKTKVCPKHKKAVNFLPDDDLQQKIRRVLVKCPKSDSGCEWKGRIYKLSNHQKECDLLLSVKAALAVPEDASSGETGKGILSRKNLLPSSVSNVAGEKSERTPSTEGVTVANEKSGVKVGSEFSNSNLMMSKGEAKSSEMFRTTDICCPLTPPLNVVMKLVSSYQASPEEIWFSSSFFSHPLGYELCLAAKFPQQSPLKADDGVRLEIGVVSAQRFQESFLKFPCIGDIKLKILNPLQNVGHKEISIGFITHNEDLRQGHMPELSYPVQVPKKFIFKDRLFFHVMAVQLSEDHRPWLLDPSLVREDSAYPLSDSDSESIDVV